MTITLQSLNLAHAERILCEHALRTEGTLVSAAERLGITRHSLKRRILKYNIMWPIPRTGIPAGLFAPLTPAPPPAQTSAGGSALSASPVQAQPRVVPTVFRAQAKPVIGGR